MLAEERSCIITNFPKNSVPHSQCAYTPFIPCSIYRNGEKKEKEREREREGEREREKEKKISKIEKEKRKKKKRT